MERRQPLQRRRTGKRLPDARPSTAVELENDGVGADSALAQLVDALNQATSGAPYALIDPGEPRLGRHAIAVGILYRPSAATPVGRSAILDRRAHPDFDDARNRPNLAQTFESRGTHDRFTVVVNHFKSKGSNCDAIGDRDIDDGQGECNLTRTRAARGLVEWLAESPTHANETPVLIAGDLNAYPMEDPVRAIEAAGYVDLVPFVAGAAVWHANADEARVLDYRGATSPERFRPDPFRASDHDPVLVGLFPDADADGLTDARDAFPHSQLGETVVIDGCDSGAPEFLDASGCSLSDRLLALRGGRPASGHIVRRAGQWLSARIEEGAVARRDRGHILACVARRERPSRWRG